MPGRAIKTRPGLELIGTLQVKVVGKTTRLEAKVMKALRVVIPIDLSRRVRPPLRQSLKTVTELTFRERAKKVRPTVVMTMPFKFIPRTPLMSGNRQKWTFLWLFLRK